MYRLKYTMLQTLYWCSAAVIFCFAASFLQGCGFTNAETGLIVALGNLFGLLASVLLGSWLDRSQCGPFRPALLILALYIAASVALILQSGNNILTGLCFVLCFGCNLVLNPVYIRVAGLIQSGDPGFRFSVPRGAGSLAFALTAWATGLLVQAASVSSLPPAMACTAFLQIPVLFSLRGVSQSSVLSGIEPVRGASLRTFLRRMPRFALLLLGITLIFAANNTVNNFLINVVHNAGGTYADLGRLTFFSSVVEFPAMLFYSRQNPRRQKNCLRLAGCS